MDRVLALLAVPVNVATDDLDASKSGLAFIENVGNSTRAPASQVRGGPATLWLTADALWFTWVDANRPAYVLGETTSDDFPLTPDAYDTSFGGLYDGFVTKLITTTPLPDLSRSTKTVAPEAALVGETVTYTVRLVNSGTLSDTASATTTVYALGGYDLTIQKEIVSSGPYDYGDQIRYNITISNTGQLAADVTVNDAIPEGTQYVPGSAFDYGDAMGSSLDDSDGITWQGNLDAGDAQVIEFKVEIISAEGMDCGLISNQASASIAGTGYTWLATADANVRSPDLTVNVAPQEHAAKNDHGEFAPYTATVTYENKDDHDHPGLHHHADRHSSQRQRCLCEQ